MNGRRRLHKHRTCFKHRAKPSECFVTLSACFQKFIDGVVLANTALTMWLKPNKSLQRRADRSVGHARRWRPKGTLAAPRRQMRTSQWLTRQSSTRGELLAYSRVIQAFIDGVEVPGIKSMELRGPSHDSFVLDDMYLSGDLAKAEMTLVGEAGPELAKVIREHGQ